MRSSDTPPDKELRLRRFTVEGNTLKGFEKRMRKGSHRPFPSKKESVGFNSGPEEELPRAAVNEKGIDKEKRVYQSREKEKTSHRLNPGKSVLRKETLF